MKRPEKNLSEWDVNDVCEFLRENGFEQYCEKFKNHKINGEILTEIDEDDLRKKPFSMEILGDIKGIHRLIQSIKEHIEEDSEPLLNNEAMDVIEEISQKVPKFLVKRGFITTENLEKFVEFVPKTRSEFRTWFKLFLSFVFFMTVYLIALGVIVYVDSTFPSTDRDNLSDIFLDNVPRIEFAFSLAEVCILIEVVIFFFVLLFHKYRLVILRRFFVTFAILYLLRSITIFATSLPTPGVHLRESCIREGSITLESFIKKYIQLVLTFGLTVGGFSSCGDYLFSGHTVFLTLIRLFIVRYTKNFFGFHSLMNMINIGGVFLILLAHEHYTIDCVIAYYLSSRIFEIYHIQTTLYHFIKDKSDRIYTKYGLITILERGNDSITQNEISLPCSRRVKDCFRSPNCTTKKKK